MDRRREMLESLLEAYDLMLTEVSPEELASSGMFPAWLHQVASALLVTDMELERRVWDQVREIPVSLHERAALEAYGVGMRALLLGILHGLESEEESIRES